MKKKEEKIQELENQIDQVRAELKQNLTSSNLGEINVQNLVNSKVVHLKDEIENYRKKNRTLESRLEERNVAKREQE